MSTVGDDVRVIEYRDDGRAVTLHSDGRRVDSDVCGDQWSTDHSDGFYGLSAECDKAAGHDGEKHTGPVVTWDGDDEQRPAGVRLEWP